MVKPRVAVCVPAAITGIESDAVVEAVVAAGAQMCIRDRRRKEERRKAFPLFFVQPDQRIGTEKP